MGAVGYFFSGSFSGIWTGADWSNWGTQQFWNSTQSAFDPTVPLSAYLPQNQNPQAQSAIWEGQYVAQVNQAFAEANAAQDQQSCADQLAQGVQQHTGVSITSVQDAGSIGGHENYTFDVAESVRIPVYT
jgi:hypothetical protein